MSLDILTEAFKRLEALNEEVFDTSFDGVNKLQRFMDEDDFSDDLMVIDDNAETEDDLQDSYVGKVIVNCNVCHSHIFKDREDIDINDEGDVNIDVECPYCGELGGYTIVGQINEFKSDSDAEDAIIDDETSDIEELEDTISDDEDESNDDAESDNVANESFNRSVLNEESNMDKIRKHFPELFDDELTEDFKKVDIETNDQRLSMESDETGRVSVVTEPINADYASDEEITEESTISADGETVQPLSDEDMDQLIDGEVEEGNISEDQPEEEIEDFEQSEVEDEEAPVEATEEEVVDEEGDFEESFDKSSVDVEVEDGDEKTLNELGRKFLNEIYENVDDFETTAFRANDKNLVVEGLIKFKSGNVKKTGFIFESKYIDSKKNVKFVGFNEHFSKNPNSFILNGKIQDKKIIFESLSCDYIHNNAKVEGTVKVD